MLSFFVAFQCDLCFVAMDNFIEDNTIPKLIFYKFLSLHRYFFMICHPFQSAFIKQCFKCLITDIDIRHRNPYLGNMNRAGNLFIRLSLFKRRQRLVQPKIVCYTKARVLTTDKHFSGVNSNS